MSKDKKQQRLVVLDGMVRLGCYTLSEIKDRVNQKALGTIKNGVSSISDKTLRNDLKELEEIHDTQIESVYNPADNSYRYRYVSQPDALADAYLNPQHLRALYLARDALRTTHAIPEAKDIEDAIQQLQYMLVDYEQAMKIPPVEKVVRFCSSRLRPVDPRIWKELYKCVENYQVIELTYQSAWGEYAKLGVAKRYEIHPLRLVNLDGEWYLFGLFQNELRQFHLHRIKKIENSPASFHVPPDFDLDQRLEHVFGNYMGNPMDLVPITLRFSRQAAPMVEGHIFHPRQQEKTLADGRLEFTFWVTRQARSPEMKFYKVRQFVMSYGAECEIIQPNELRDLVRGDLEAALKQHASSKEAACERSAKHQLE